VIAIENVIALSDLKARLRKKVSMCRPLVLVAVDALHILVLFVFDSLHILILVVVDALHILNINKVSYLQNSQIARPFDRFMSHMVHLAGSLL
jgi:flagellar biosynthesis protein FliR